MAGKGGRSASGGEAGQEAGSIAPDTRTRVRIITAAERLFGERGIDAVPLREVGKEAGQRNTNSVQYHFGGRLELLRAIFEYREAGLEPRRRELLETGAAHAKLDDVRWLLRVCFEPNFLHYFHDDGIAYIRLHAQYLSTHRPRGVTHPVDDESPSTASFRRAIALLRSRLSFLDERRFNLRLESVGTMFLGALIQHAARANLAPWSADRLFGEILEMMAAAITTPPWGVEAGSG